jgi:hypothetical protein
LPDINRNLPPYAEMRGLSKTSPHMIATLAYRHGVPTPVPEAGKVWAAGMNSTSVNNISKPCDFCLPPTGCRTPTL